METTGDWSCCMWLVLSLSVPTCKVGASPRAAGGLQGQAHPKGQCSSGDYHQLPSGLWESLGLGTLINASSLPSARDLQEEPMEPRGRAGTRVQAALSPLLPCSPPSLPRSSREIHRIRSRAPPCPPLDSPLRTAEHRDASQKH